MKDSIEMWHPEPNAGGDYELWDAIEEERIWATRTTPVKKYVDDVLFEFFGDPTDFRVPGCTIKAKSRSQSLSVYDYNTNYCNMWNVINQVTGEQGDIDVSECAWPSKTPEVDCLKY